RRRLSRFSSNAEMNLPCRRTAPWAGEDRMHIGRLSNSAARIFRVGVHGFVGPKIRLQRDRDLRSDARCLSGLWFGENHFGSANASTWSPRLVSSLEWPPA